jgi:pimeloyl-ACP methyl ester carboxylesterase
VHQGAPAVFVHGGFPFLAFTLEDFDQWTWTWELDFARRFRFVWYHRRGCYRSEAPLDGHGLENQARHLAGLLDHLQVPSAHVVASSAGGPISVVFAARYPQRTRSLVLAGTGLALFPQGEPVSELIGDQIALLERLGPNAAFERCPRGVEATPRRAASLFRPWRRPRGVEATLSVLWAHAEAEARRRLAAYLDRRRPLDERARQVRRAGGFTTTPSR